MFYPAAVEVICQAGLREIWTETLMSQLKKSFFGLLYKDTTNLGWCFLHEVHTRSGNSSSLMPTALTF